MPNACNIYTWNHCISHTHERWITLNGSWASWPVSGISSKKNFTVSAGSWDHSCRTQTLSRFRWSYTGHCVARPKCQRKSCNDVKTACRSGSYDDFYSAPVISLEWVKLRISNFLCSLTDFVEYQLKHDILYPQRAQGYVRVCHVALLHFWAHSMGP